MLKLKFKRIEDENGEYEDGDNFDKHLTKKKSKKAFQNIDNPYLFLENN